MSFNDILEKWVAPTGILTLIGGIVWGIQLNAAVMQLTAEQAHTTTKLAKIKTADDEMSRNLLEVTLLLKQMQTEHVFMQKQFQDHEKDSAAWKHKIIRLEEHVENGNGRNRQQ